MKDKRYRSIIKAISYRITGTINTFIISYIVTGKFTFALTIGFIELITKIFIYYLHERLWERIKFGKIETKEIDYQI